MERIGYGIVTRSGSQLLPGEHGVVVTPRIELAGRLNLLHMEMVDLLARLRPDVVATERLLFSVNKTTAMDVAKALGVILLASAQAGIDWSEYSPPEVKQAVVGTGSADKRQVQYMVQRLLSIQEKIRPDDVADALAIAITHVLRSRIAHPITSTTP